MVICFAIGRPETADSCSGNSAVAFSLTGKLPTVFSATGRVAVSARQAISGLPCLLPGRCRPPA